MNANTCWQRENAEGVKRCVGTYTLNKIPQGLTTIVSVVSIAVFISSSIFSTR